MKERTYTIYALIDPRDNSIRYIGKTYDPDKRKEEHLRGGDGNVPKREWIYELRQLGLTPIMQPIEIGLSLAVALERETMWIQHYLNAGMQLVNLRNTPYRSYTVKYGIGGKSNTSSAARPRNKVTLAELITEAGLRKTELAAESGVSYSTIDHVIRGDSTSKATVVKLGRVIEKHLNRRIDINGIEGLNIAG